MVNLKNNSRSAKTVKNAIVSVSSSLLKYLFSYLTRVVFVLFLNESYLGINGLFSTVLSILSLADLGITSAVMFSLYKPIHDNDEEKIRILINFFKKVYLGIFVAILFLGFALIPLLPYIVNLPSDIDHLTSYYLLFVLDSAISYLFVYRTCLLSADQKQYVVNLFTCAFQVITFVGQILILAIFKSYFAFLLIKILTTLICNLSCNIYTYHAYPFLKVKSRERIDSADKKIIVSNVKATFLHRIAAMIVNQTDSIFISMMISTILVGYYSNYVLVVSGITSFVTMFIGAVNASIANFSLDNSDPNKRISLFLNIFSAGSLIIGFCSVSFACLFKDFIVFSYGESYLLSVPVLFAIIINFITDNIRQPVYGYMSAMGLFKPQTKLTCITAVLNLILSYVLGVVWGMFGILIATSIARILCEYWAESIYLFKGVFSSSAKKFIARLFLDLAFIIGLSYAMYLLTSLADFGLPIFNFFVKLCLVFAFGLPVICFWERRGFIYVMNRLAFLTRRIR